MDSRLRNTSSGKPPAREMDEAAQSTPQRQLPLLLPQPPEPVALRPPEETSGRQTSSLSNIAQDQARESKGNHNLRALTSPGGSGSSSVKFTRTGRISKAAKGQRIHACHIDGCEKVFSRAEHLRRHQNSHRPGEFACDIPGCTRTFTREDLLMRHRARHVGLSEDPNRRTSAGSQTSAPDAGSLQPLSSIPRAVTSGASTDVSAPLPAESGSDVQQSQSSSSQVPKRRPIPPNELSNVRIPMEVHGPFLGFQYDPWNDSPPCAPSIFEFDSPEERFGPHYFQHQPMVVGDVANAPMLAYDYQFCPPSSPTSDSSSTMNWQWPLLSRPVYEMPFTLDDLSCDSLPYSAPAMTALTREALEQQLGLPEVVIGEDDLVHGQRYIDSYFTWVHDQLPILHRPSLSLASRQESPLLRVAILALGAQALGSPSDISNSHRLHEKCAKILENRTVQGRHTHNISDMQAIVLVEMYSIFKSKDPPPSLSTPFEEVYCVLSNDPEALLSIPLNRPESSFSGDIEIFCKQRLLLACYTLTRQHALLFGTLSSPNLSASALDIPFPTPQTQWDSPYPMLQPSCSINTLSEALTTISSAKDHHDAFRSILLVTALSDPNTALESQIIPLLKVIEPSPRVTLALHIMMMCKHTPVRDLLAFISLEKERSNDALAQIELQDWVRGKVEKDFCVQAALVHAFAVLKIHRREKRTGLLFQEWGVFLAGVVIWARWWVGGKGWDGGVGVGEEKSADLERDVDEIIQAGTSAFVGRRDARNVLSWVRRELEMLSSSRNTGLVGRALEILRKMVLLTDEAALF